MKTTNLEILSERLRGQDGSDTTVIKELVPTIVDIEKVIYENSKISKMKRWDREIFAEDKEKGRLENPPASIVRVLKISSGGDITPADIMKISKNEYKYFTSAVAKTEDKWVEKTKKGRKVTYKWTEKALEWLENQ